MNGHGRQSESPSPSPEPDGGQAVMKAGSRRTGRTRQESRLKAKAGEVGGAVEDTAAAATEEATLAEVASAAAAAAEVTRRLTTAAEKGRQMSLTLCLPLPKHDGVPL